MTIIYYTSFPERFEEETFLILLNSMPLEIKDKILKYRRWEDQHASLLGKLLLKKGLDDFKFNFGLENLKYTDYGRPYLSKEFDFNISHSGKLVACAFSTESRIGLDIEEIKTVALEDFKDLFEIGEWRSIINSKDINRTFYHYWTVKESLMKVDGRGLNLPFKKILLKEDMAMIGETIMHFKNVVLKKNYMSQIASFKRIYKVELVEVLF